MAENHDLTTNQVGRLTTVAKGFHDHSHLGDEDFKKLAGQRVHFFPGAQQGEKLREDD